MKITKSILKRIIKEELQTVLKESAQAEYQHLERTADHLRQNDAKEKPGALIHQAAQENSREAWGRVISYYRGQLKFLEQGLEDFDSTAQPRNAEEARLVKGSLSNLNQLKAAYEEQLQAAMAGDAKKLQDLWDRQADTGGGPARPRKEPVYEPAGTGGPGKRYHSDPDKHGPRPPSYWNK